MKLSFLDVLLLLPVDAALRSLVTSAGLPLPANFDWNDEDNASQRLVDAVRGWSDTSARDSMAARIMSAIQLADPVCKQALFQAASRDGAALAGLATCQSDLHRSFWLSMQHPVLFEQACEFDYLERHGSQAQQHDLGVHGKPDLSDPAMAKLQGFISAFYQKELQCGDGCVAYALERSPGLYLLTVHVKDLAMLHLEFEGVRLKRRLGYPNIHMVLEYSQRTGVARTLVRGGAKYHQMLVDAFAECLLGVKVDAQRIKPPTLDLSVLQQGFDVPKAITEDGFDILQVKSLSLLSPDSALKLDCTAMASSNHGCVTDLLAKSFPNENPLQHGWLITAAKINLYYPAEPGKVRSKPITVEVTRRGRLNLHKFDAALQAQLEGYLVTLGILQPGQTLSAQEIPDEAFEEFFQD